MPCPSRVRDLPKIRTRRRRTGPHPNSRKRFLLAKGLAGCERVLVLFDGRRRYDLKLAFKRMEGVKADKGYAGPVVVCSLAFQPLGGYRASSSLMKFLSEGREMELALAPIAGTRLLAP